MKNKIFIMTLGCFIILLNSPSFAGCGSCGSGRDSYCTEPENPCACTDPGWRYNTCISKAYFCDAFGNIGGLDE